MAKFHYCNLVCNHLLPGFEQKNVAEMQTWSATFSAQKPCRRQVAAVEFGYYGTGNLNIRTNF